MSGCGARPDAAGGAPLPADLVLLAMGFTGVQDSPLLDDLGVRLTSRRTIATSQGFQTHVEGVFAAGDARRGQSLIVWAIREGRDAATAIGRFLATRRAAVIPA